jgi:hypothetical protein
MIDEFDRDGVHECNDTLTSLFHSLTDRPKEKKASDKNQRQEVATPTLQSNDRRSLADVGKYLANPDCEIGIDHISVTFPFHDFIQDNPKDWDKGPKNQTMARKYGYWTNRFPINPEVLKGDVRFTAKVWEGRGTGTIEIKPSTILFGPKSLYLANIEEALIVLRHAYDLVGQWLELVQPFEVLKPSRIDLTYDVDKVADVQRLLKQVTYFPHNHQVSINPYLKGNGRWESVTVRSETNGGFIVYDKSRQCKKGDSVVRFEATTRSKNLEKYCPTIGHLTEETANAMFRHYFTKLINGFSQILEMPLDGLLSSDTHKLRTVEYAGIKLLKRMGHHVSFGSNRERAYKDLERMGIGGCLDAWLDKWQQ